MIEIKYMDDLLNSKYTFKEKLKNLLKLTNINPEGMNKSKMVDIILYDTVLGLDEILNILFTDLELRTILKSLDNKIDLKHFTKPNIIGKLIHLLPTKRERKIETVIDEFIDEDALITPIIYYLFLLTPDGRNLFSFNFKPIEIGDLNLFTSVLNGISLILEELTKRDKLENIELNASNRKDSELEIVFEYGKLKLPEFNGRSIIGILLVNKESKELRKKLENFILKFENEFKDKLLPYWSGRVADFYDARYLVYDIFSKYIEFVK